MKLLKSYLIENYLILEGTILEITLPELRNQDKYLSALTSKFKSYRKNIQGQGIKNTKFLELQTIEETGSFVFKMLTEATEEGDKKMDKDLPKKQYDIASKTLIDNPSHTYDVWIQVDNIFPNNKTQDISWIEVFENSNLTIKDLKEIFDVADVKIWSSDPSFQFQGFNYRLSSQQDGSIFPETIPDTIWRKKHGSNAYLTKHIAQVLDRGTFELFFNQMVSAMNKKLKELGYITKEKKV